MVQVDWWSTELGGRYWICGPTFLSLTTSYLWLGCELSAFCSGSSAFPLLPCCPCHKDFYLSKTTSQNKFLLQRLWCLFTTMQRKILPKQTPKGQVFKMCSGRRNAKASSLTAIVTWQLSRSKMCQISGKRIFPKGDCEEPLEDINIWMVAWKGRFLLSTVDKDPSIERLEQGHWDTRQESQLGLSLWADAFISTVLRH